MRGLSSLPILILSVLSWTCSDRQRLNPLDPSNPSTYGKPGPVRLASDRTVVSVSWDPIDNRSITGYTLRRFPGVEDDTSVVATVPREVSSGLDTVSCYDSTYMYIITAMTDSWESPSSEPSTIIPGPFNYWITDFYDGAISKVSYDGAHAILRDYQYSPIAVDLDPEREHVWIATLYPSRIVRLSLEGEVQLEKGLSSIPADIAVDPESGGLLVASAGLSEIIRMTSDGTVAGELSCGITVSRSSRLAIDSENRNAWLTVADSHAVIRMDFQSPGQVDRFNISPSPRAITLLPARTVAWVATDSGMVAIGDDGETGTYLPNHIIYDLSVNEEAEEVWAVASDRLGMKWGIYTVRFLEDDWSADEFQTEVAGMFSRIVTNPGSENGGILVYDALEHQIMRMNLQGNVMGFLPGFSPHIDMEIEHD